jgi:polysaccharide export outer membrane protein
MKLLTLTLLPLLLTVSAFAQSGQANSESRNANLPAQKIGANDLIAVAVYQAPELTRTVRVGADGFIRLPMLRQRIKAESALPSQLEEAITEALRAESILVDPVVTVTMVEYHSRPISIVGAVRRPLTYQAVGPVTLLDAIARAEGLSPDAGPEILVSRSQPGEDGAPTVLTQRIPLHGLIDEADPELNVRLFGGEEIRVPEVGKVYVVGNVKRPGAFPVQDSNGTSVLKLLAIAEGLLPYTGKQAFVYRRNPGSEAKNEITIELGKIVDRKSPDVPLQPNDILYIPDNKGKKLAFTTLERLAGFGSNTASGVLIWRR